MTGRFSPTATVKSVRKQTFRAPSRPETDGLPAVGGVHERDLCLSRLATIAAAAA